MNKFITISIIALWMLQTAQAQSGTIHRSGTTGGLSWTISGGTADANKNIRSATLTISGNGDMPNYESKDLSSNAPWDIYRFSISTIVINNGVRSIGNFAFRYFGDLSSVTIPNSVTRIGIAAFGHCLSLTSVTIPNSVTAIGERAFDGCSGLTSIVIGSSVKTIGMLAFAYCIGLKSVTIPNSVTTIGNQAFAGCFGLTTITIPSSVTLIENLAFAGCANLTSFLVANGNTVYSAENGILFNRSKTELIAYPGGKSNLEYSIPASITAIGFGAFYGSRFTSVTIPNSVTSIGELAFSESELTSVTIPGSVATIGARAFDSCRQLRVIVNNATRPQPLSGDRFNSAFRYVNTSAVRLRVPAASLAAYRAAEGWKDFVNIEAIDGILSDERVNQWHNALKNAINANPRLTWDDGSRYKGENRTNGTGVYLWGSGNFHFGGFRDNRFNGHGICMIVEAGSQIIDCPGARIYAGNYQNGPMSGSGTAYDVNGRVIYRGEFAEGKPQGAYPSTGDFSAYRFDIVNAGGNIYIGETRTGRRHGYGILVYANGDMWYGSWQNDNRNEETGVLIRRDGTVQGGAAAAPARATAPAISGAAWREMLEQAISANPTVSRDGNYIKGQLRNGMAAVLANEGTIRFVNFVENRVTGQAIHMVRQGYQITNCPGAMFYSGNWLNGERSGAGAVYDSSGKLLYRGEFAEGKPQGAYPSTGDFSAYRFDAIDYDGGNRYVGETRNSRPHGNGIYVWANGDMWYGPWTNGARSGAGILIRHDGSVQTGSWQGDTHTP